MSPSDSIRYNKNLPLQGASHEARHRSLWLKDALAGVEPAAALEGNRRADVAIIGGGYTGLWTAIHIRQHDPSCNVVVLERDLCGSGASGRNGGFVMSWWPKLSTLVQMVGVDAAVSLVQSSVRAIEDIRDFCHKHRIDADFRNGGWLWTATTPAQIGAWGNIVETCRNYGIDFVDNLSEEEVARRTGSATHLAGVLDASGSTVDPAALAVGLRAVAQKIGVVFHENTRVTRLRRRYPPVLESPNGTLTATKVVIATNAWAAGIRELHTSIAAISSDVIATPPIPERLAAIGWTGSEGITDSQMMINYYRTTRDGRVVFGKGGWGYAIAGRIGPRFDRDRKRAAQVEADFRRVYPNLSDVPVTEDWSGPVARSVSGLPVFGKLGGHPHLLYGVGWSGNGVGPSLLGGRVLASLALDLDDEWSEFPLLDPVHRRFPPDPIRAIGAYAIRAGVSAKESAEANGRKPSRLSVSLARLAPSAGVRE